LTRLFFCIILDSRIWIFVWNNHEQEAHTQCLKLDEGARTMFTFASEETYENGEIIIKEGTPGNWIYYIISGAVEISKNIGGRKFILGKLEAGEIFGEIGFIGGMKRTATAVAIGPTTVGIIDRETLDEEFNKIPSDFRAILVAMARRFEKMALRVAEFSERKDVRVQKTLSLTYKDNQSFVKAYVGNVSSSGLFIKTPNPLKEGERFHLRLQLPDAPEALNVSCEVVWARNQAKATEKSPAGMGVKFIEMSRKDKETLDRYVSKATRSLF
jgi:CRP/FNR family cyclic AMP-dependent transcriptional regulator